MATQSPYLPAEDYTKQTPSPAEIRKMTRRAFDAFYDVFKPKEMTNEHWIAMQDKVREFRRGRR